MLGVGSAAWQFVLFLVVLAAVVLFHELGHFLAAKLIGVRVEVFSFGFGKRLVGRRVGDTDYRVSLVPLGGYVRMSGDFVPPEERTGSSQEFDSRRSWEKLLIMLMGPAFNLVLAIAILTSCFMLGTPVPAYLRERVLVEHVELDSPAHAAGMKVGDMVTAVDGQPVRDWESFRNLELVSPGARMLLSVERDGQPVEVVVDVAERTKHAIGYVGIYPCHRVQLRAVNAGGPAAEAGLVADDAVMTAGGEPTCTVEGFIRSVQRGAGSAVPMTVERGGRTVEISVVPRWNDAQDKWIIGVGPQEVAGTILVERLGPGEALRRSLERNWHYTKLLGKTLGRLVTGNLSFRSMSGPMEIASLAEETAGMGLVPFLQLTAFISLNLAIFNLLPIPILDGGRIAILLVEAVRGRALGELTKEWILRVGFAMIVALMVVVLYFDLVKKFEQ